MRPAPPLSIPGIRFLVTCEHGGNAIPDAYRAAFADAGAALDSHEGYDAGALEMGQELAAALDAPLVAATVSRLLIDLNRSDDHPDLYSRISAGFDAARRREIFRRHYRPYRAAVEAHLERWLAAGERVIHFSSHSFTPELRGVVRDADLGLLYDPGRPGEAALCRAWKAAIGRRLRGFRIRQNYPYTGTSDGLTAGLRRRFGGDRYLGIEIEFNQAQVFAGRDHWKRVRHAAIDALIETFRRRAGGR